MQFKEKKKKAHGINITSLIDVMFILLIFFMVSSSFVEQPGMKLELPTIKSKQVARIENLVIYISKDDQVYLQNQKVELETLGEAIKKQIPNLEEKNTGIKGR